MDFLFDLFPLIFFFVAYKFYGIYAATGVLIVCTLIQNIVHYLKHKKFNKVHLTTLVLTAVLGGATILLHDPIFLKWKPSVVYLLFAAGLLIFPFFSEQNLIEKMMSKQFQMPKPVWKKLNIAWAMFFLFMALLNIYVAFYYGKSAYDEVQRMDIWVKFKTFGTTILLLAFTIGQIFFIHKYIDTNQSKPNGDSL